MSFDWAFIYNSARKYFIIVLCCISPLTFFINAPFGRFSPKSRRCLVDGRISWIIMELFSPLFFFVTFYWSPLSYSNQTKRSSNLLAILFLTHYLNRAILSPLSTPSRSKAHITVPLSAITFNIVNGSLMGTYLSSPDYLATKRSPFVFGLGIVLWLFGFVGNIYHDNILFNIRRRASQKKKRKEGTDSEYYGIPTGGLYTFISYPNYFCEWIEWFGFAIASSPFSVSLSTVTPPWIFLITELCFMLPRAYRGHQWYHLKFGDEYPKERKAVIPFVY